MCFSFACKSDVQRGEYRISEKDANPLMKIDLLKHEIEPGAAPGRPGAGGGGGMLIRFKAAS